MSCQFLHAQKVSPSLSLSEHNLSVHIPSKVIQHASFSKSYDGPLHSPATPHACDVTSERKEPQNLLSSSRITI
ncbi:hypothetical protein BD309DRAFT_626032 [Dichomitus squalens]|nr:hypothetical protein BD309DRAFT_626032 [Dichomitus squalens]